MINKINDQSTIHHHHDFSSFIWHIMTSSAVNKHDFSDMNFNLNSRHLMIKILSHNNDDFRWSYKALMTL
jgi:hypothetical protein